MAKTPSKADSIFRLAISKAPALRAAYLDDACGQATDLRHDVERLLDSHGETRDFAAALSDVEAQDDVEPDQETHSLAVDAMLLDTHSLTGPKPRAAGAAEDGLELGRQFGDYELLEKLGVGGMGVVFKARQISLKRIVALKMIKAGEFADSESLERFQKEAEAAANLDHPGIVPAFEVGAHQGQNYFSMGYVEGESLADRLRAGPLAPKEAAELLEQIAVAIEFAHRQGVVHRDLKPGNILITTAGVPKITDFGLAKRIEEDSGLTHTGQILGTPSYMSPEQAAGSLDVGQAADVYALGAILYSLLTGRPPFQAASVVDTLRQVLDREPIVPRQLNPAIPKDLETICLKCLNKSPDRRYESAGLVAEDIGRWLRMEPIVARPISGWERSLRWCQRRPTVAALIALVIVVSSVGFGLVASQWRRAEANYAEAVANFNESEKQRKRRDVNFAKVSEAVDDLLTRVGDKGLLNVPGMSQVRRNLLADALKFYEGFITKESDDPELVAESGKAYHRIGQIHQLLEEHEQAEQSFQGAIVLFERLLDKYPNRREFKQELATAQQNLGRLWFSLARFEEAESMYARGLKLNRELVRDEPADVVSQLDLASTLADTGLLMVNTQRRDDAEQRYLEALSIYESLDEATRATEKCRNRWAHSHFYLGELLTGAGKSDDAERHYNQALVMRESLSSEFPLEMKYRKELATSHRVLGRLLIRSGQLDKARESMDAAISTFEQLVADFPHVPQYRADLAVCCNTTAIICVRLGQSQDIEMFFTREVETYEDLVADFPQRLAYRRSLGVGYYNLGILMAQSRRGDQSLVLQEKGLKLRRQTAAEHPESHPYRSEVAISCEAVANALPEERSDEAEALLREAIGLGETLVQESPDTPRYKHKLAQGYRTLGEQLSAEDPQQAESYFLKAVSAFEELHAADPKNAAYRRFIVFTLDPLGHLQLSLGQTAAAEKAVRKECDILDQLVLDFDGVAQFRRERAAGRIALGRILALTAKQEEALELLQKALNELVELHDETPENTLIQDDLYRTHSVLARLYSTWQPVDSRDQVLALEHASKAVAGDGEKASFRTTLAMVHYQREDWTKAIELLTAESDEATSDETGDETTGDETTGDETDWLLLSMCHSKLQQPTEAAQWFEKANAALREKKLIDAEVQRYRQAAEALLSSPKST